MEEMINENECEEISAENVTPPLEESSNLEEQENLPTVDELDQKRQLLEEQILALEGELERKKAEADKKASEYTEFKKLYPDVNENDLDPEVTDMVNGGVPLAAAYALYEKKQAQRNAEAVAHNKATKSGGFGSLGRNSDNEFYTPDEVRAMTRADVRKNYQQILRSMENWH